MIEIFTGIRRIGQASDWKKVLDLASEDKHPVFMPTHVAVRDGEIIGHISLGVIPLVLAHFSMAKMEAIDSFMVGNIIENMLSERGAKNVCMPISVNSPFHKGMTNPKLGWQNLATMDLFLKEL